MAEFSFIDDELSELEHSDMLRKLRCIESIHGPAVRLTGDANEKILFCSNNYLNITGDAKVAEAVIDAVRRYGYGAGASRLICGTMQGHAEVEQRFAEFFSAESALLFSSGWTANQAVLTTIPQEGDLVLLDKLDHASIIDAARAGKATFRTYRRNDPAKLEKLLADSRFKRKFIVTESVFSMDGDKADLARLVELKKKYSAILIVDEAHAAGCMGDRGAGLADELELLDEVDIVVAPLGKAFGATGAIVAAAKNVTDYLINKARGFIYTTAPSPVNCAALLAALEIVRSEPQRRQSLAANSKYLRARLNTLGLDTASSTSHIIPVIIGDSGKTLTVSSHLYERGYFAAAIRPPTVAAGTARLRISVQAGHTKEQLEGLANALSEAMRISAV